MLLLFIGVRRVSALIDSSLTPGEARHSTYTARRVPRTRSLCRSFIASREPLRDQARLVAAFAFHDNGPRHLYPMVGNVFYRLQGKSAAHFRTGLHRRSETNPVKPVVHSHANLSELERFTEQRTEQGKCQKAMRDGRAKRRFGDRALALDMDPLAIAGRLGKVVDAFLGDFQPIGDNDLLAHEILEVLQGIYGDCWHGRSMVSDKITDQLIHLVRLLVHHPMRGIGNTLDGELGNVLCQSIEQAREQRAIPFAPDNQSWSSDGKARR